MTNIDYIRTHIEASAPCSLFSVAAWADTQLDIDAARFVGIIDFLVASNAISIEHENCNLTIDLN